MAEQKEEDGKRESKPIYGLVSENSVMLFFKTAQLPHLWNFLFQIFYHFWQSFFVFYFDIKKKTKKISEENL